MTIGACQASVHATRDERTPAKPTAGADPIGSSSFRCYDIYDCFKEAASPNSATTRMSQLDANNKHLQYSVIIRRG